MPLCKNVCKFVQTFQSNKICLVHPLTQLSLETNDLVKYLLKLVQKLLPTVKNIGLILQ